MFKLTNQITTTPLVTLLLIIVTCGIYGIYAYYKWGKAIPEIFKEKNSIAEDRSALYLLLGIFGLAIISLALLQSDLNRYSTL